MIRQRAYYNQSLLIVMEEVYAKKIFRIVADTQMTI